MVKINKKIVGWITFIIALSIISLWSYWGINEAFHEGWYHTSVLDNLLLTFVQYLSIPIIFIILSIIAMKYKRVGFGLFIAMEIFALFFFDSNAARILIFIPLMLLALGFFIGEFKYKRLFTALFILIPLLTVLSFGIPQLARVENRYNDGDFGTRTIVGNDVSLTWAPQGVGFPLEGTDWQSAKDNCAQLNQGLDIWRLPTREEVVRSMTRDNKNSMGIIEDGVARYEVKPDKETPLWNPYSKVIYYWTNDSVNEKRAYLVAYNGRILERSKDLGADYQGYRCVKN